MTSMHRIVFVCLHGSAKSVIAAEECHRLTRERGLAFQATAAGTEPDAEIPAHVVRGLLAEGIDVRGRRPRRVSRDDLAAASRVVAFGCDLADVAPAGVVIALRRDFTLGALTNLLNPKVALFYLTFLPQFIDPHGPALPQLLLLAGLHIGMGVVWLTAYARGVDQFAGWLGRPRIRRGFDGMIGALLVGLGVRLALERR